jgi:hypothetical protein
VTGSTEEAEVTFPAGTPGEHGGTESLERLGRAYWLYLRRISWGLLRVVCADGAPSVVLGSRRVVLLSFRAPHCDTGPDFGRITWPIERGILVAPWGRGRGHLRFDLRRAERGIDGRESVRVSAVVADYHPLFHGSGRFARLGGFIYALTQLRVHVLITRGFLRSLPGGMGA